MAQFKSFSGFESRAIKLTRQINSPTKPSRAGVTQSKMASPSKAPNENIVVDEAKVSLSGAKLTNTGPRQHSYRESNVSRKCVLSEDIEGATELKRLPTPINLFEDECVYCHSFRTSPFHGPMVRYLKGRLVPIDEGNPSNGIYVHRTCLEWAPRVWFKGDIVMNLEIEISRSSRLRCSRCGLLGAALGCYYKRCNKSFHVPCAVQIFDCRWDADNGFVLCPEHVSKMLPCDEMSSQTKEKDNSSSLPRSQCSHKEESFTIFNGECQQIDQLNTTSPFLPLGQYSDKEGIFYDHQREKQQTNQLKTSSSSSLPQSQCSHKEEASTNSSREGQQIDQLNTSSSSSLLLDQQSDKEGISNYRVDYRQKDQLDTSNYSSLPQSCHPDEEGISNACQAEETKSDQLDTPSCPSDQWVLLGSSLSASEKDSLQKFGSWTDATVTKEWAKNVTHVIVGKNAGSKWSRSYEVLMAILSGKWVVQAEWIVDCLELRPGPEASYEVTFSNDSHRSFDGPKKGRIRAAEGAPKLFSGRSFCLSAHMSPDDRDHLRDLIAAAEGRILEGSSNQLHLLRESSLVKPYFVYDGGAPTEFTSSSLLDLKEGVEHAAAGAQVISHRRVLDAIAAYDAEVLNQKGWLHSAGFVSVVSVRNE
ncbi:BRCA1-associated RING domain protein 1-like isoform X2 [Phragmites australis]|uniref:BRCA1-associated RING domain protein 1-like isoform X2 n=1 Tax=Phragmites australis TaxID=29695 RepID=UPI002D795498|nr:BRCA1-associated RING domain protein 1-like isoform X2 [Phragmites australis]